MMQTYTMTIAAGGQWVHAASGRYLRIIAATAAVSIDFFAKGNQKGTADGVGVGFWVKPTQAFDQIVVRSATAQTVTLMIGSGDAGYDQVAVVGNVNTYSGEQQDVPYTSIRSMNIQAQGAGNYSMFAIRGYSQRQGPTRLESMKVSVGQACQVKAGWVQWATGFLVGPSNIGNAGMVYSRYGTGPYSNNSYVYYPSAVQAAPPTFLTAYQFALPANTPVDILDFPVPIILDYNAGYLFCVAALTANTSLDAVFQLRDL